MRIAAFNVENLFDRAKAFNDSNQNVSQRVLDAHSELNQLFENDIYQAAQKARMLVLIQQLGMLRNDEGPHTRIRKIRGRLIVRPRSNPVSIVANGRSDWVGWCELRTSSVNEIAIENTGRVIRDMNADVLAIVEAESRPVVKEFQKIILRGLNANVYRHIMVIDGNDDRGIDVGLMTKQGFPIRTIRSHVDDLRPNGGLVYSRDCPEYEVVTPSGQHIYVLPNHFKSKYGGNDPASRAKRKAQAESTASIYQRLVSEGRKHVVVLGDLNDTPNSQELAPLLSGTNLVDVSHHPQFTSFQFRATNGHKGIGTHGLGNDTSKIDYILLSPSLFQKVVKGGIFRKGAWPGSRPKRWDVYPELKEKVHAASDHHALWVDINF